MVLGPPHGARVHLSAVKLSNATGPGLVADCANRPPKLALPIRIYRVEYLEYLTPPEILRVP